MRGGKEEMLYSKGGRGGHLISLGSQGNAVEDADPEKPRKEKKNGFL